MAKAKGTKVKQDRRWRALRKRAAKRLSAQRGKHVVFRDGKPVFLDSGKNVVAVRKAWGHVPKPAVAATA